MRESSIAYAAENKSLKQYGYGNQDSPDHDVKQVIRRLPAKVLAREESPTAGNVLVQVDEAETKIERPHRIIATENNDQNAYETENDVKDIVGRGAARQALFLRNEETEYAYQNQQRGEGQ